MGHAIVVERSREAVAAGELLLTRGDLSAAEERFTEALTQAARADARAFGTGDPSHHRQRSSVELARVAAAARVGMGRVRLRRRQFHQSLFEFYGAQRLYPHAWEGFYWAGCAQAWLADYADAEASFTQALASAAAAGSERGRAHVQRAFTRLRLGREDAALDDLVAAAELGTLDDGAALLLAGLRLRRREWSDAVPQQGGDPPRACREPAALLRQAALDEAGAGRWEAAGRILATCRERTSAPGDWPVLDAVLLMLGGRRAAALDLLAAAAARNPADRRVAHARALMLFHTLGSPEAARGVPEHLATWRTCIAAWGAVLYDSEFWAGWYGAAERRYGQPPGPSSAASLQSLRNGLRNLLEARMTEITDGPAGLGAGVRSQELVVLLQREVEAAHVLARLGGFPLPGEAGNGNGGRNVVCGPLRIAELGLQREFGVHVAALAASSVVAPGSGADTDLTQLLVSFSELGIAQVLMLGGRTREAVDALADVRCPSCRRAGPVRSGGPSTCAPGCAGFDAANPAYAAFADKHRRFAADALSLTAQALLSLGEAALTASPPDLDAASRYWREALDILPPDLRPRTRLSVAETALGRSRTLRRRGDRERAIAVLEAARDVCGGSPRLDGALAGVLTRHGIRIANDDDRRVEEAVNHLRRAVELNPHLPPAVSNLPKALRMLARQKMADGSIADATGLMKEADSFPPAAPGPSPSPGPSPGQQGSRSSQD